MPDSEPKPAEPPLLAGRIQGIRCWDVLNAGPKGPAILGSISSDRYWPPGAVIEAHCLACREPHVSPAPDCPCGLYAYHPWRAEAQFASADLDWHEDYGARGHVCGIVEAWGRIEVHADGFRSQFARIAALLRSGTSSEECEWFDRLASDYGAEVLEWDDDDPEVLAPRGLGEGMVEESLLADSTIELRAQARGWMTRRGDAIAGSGFLPRELDRSDRSLSPWIPEWDTECTGARVIRVAGGAHRGQSIQHQAFSPGRRLRLEPEPTNVADRDAIAVWDAELSVQAGYVPAKLAPAIGKLLREGRVRDVRSAWQWRDIDTGERIGLHILVSASRDVRCLEPSGEGEYIVLADDLDEIPF